MPDLLHIGLPCNISPSKERRDFYKGKEIHFNDAVFGDVLFSFRDILPQFIPIGESRALAKKYVTAIDGLLLTGGRDMSPSFYGEKALAKKYTGETKRPRFEIWLVRYALQYGIPILGICQGCQVINVALGGTLFQDLPAQDGTRKAHSSKGRKVTDCRHPIRIMQDSRLSRILRKKRLVVNSAHHQAVNKVGRGLRIAAEAEDGVIEAIERAGEPFCMGLQWHAEQMAGDTFNRKIFLAFFKACREARESGI